MNDHVPSLNNIVDSVILRREYTTDQAEYDALTEALAVIEAYAFRERRTISVIEKILRRIATIGGERAA